MALMAELLEQVQRVGPEMTWAAVNEIDLSELLNTIITDPRLTGLTRKTGFDLVHLKLRIEGLTVGKVRLCFAYSLHGWTWLSFVVFVDSRALRV